MTRQTIRIGVVVVSRKPISRWAARGFAPIAALDAAPETAPGAVLAQEGDATTLYAGPAEVTLHSGETGHYRDNLSGRPSVWVALAQGGEAPRIVAATVNPHEGEALAGDDGLVVEAVAMPPALQQTVAAFFAAHHVEVAFEKRKRRRADPEALARRGPLGGEGGR